MHTPVLRKEVVKYLDPGENENFIDCTLGQGGHTSAILKRTGPRGKVLGIERTPELVEAMGKKERLIAVQGNFANLKKIVREKGFGPVSGVLMDLGFSSWHIEESGKGFSFQRDEPLIMRYDGEEEGVTAGKILNTWPKEKIALILKRYGEERFSDRIAEKVVETRKEKEIRTTRDLVEAIKRATPGWYHRKRIHPATRTFQGLRIAVNEELDNLRKVLPQSLEVLDRGGRVVTIAFHSLEDRIIKNFFRKKEEENKLKVLTKKPVRPSREEVKENPSSRSARLRAAEKL